MAPPIGGLPHDRSVERTRSSVGDSSATNIPPTTPPEPWCSQATSSHTFGWGSDRPLGRLPRTGQTLKPHGRSAGSRSTTSMNCAIAWRPSSILGASLREVMARGSWKSVSMVACYQHASDERDTLLAKSMPSLLSGAGTTEEPALAVARRLPNRDSEGRIDAENAA